VKVLSKNKIGTNRTLSTLDNFFFKNIVIKKSQVFDFLSTTFVENVSDFRKDSFTVENFTPKDNKKISFIYTHYIKVKYLTDFTYFFSSDFLSVDLKEFRLPITFYFKRGNRKMALTDFFPLWLI